MTFVFAVSVVAAAVAACKVQKAAEAKMVPAPVVAKWVT